MIFTMALTNFTETMFCEFKNFTDVNKNHRLSKLVGFVDKIPTTYFLFIIGTALSAQMRILYPSLVNKYFHRVVKVIANERADRKIENFLKYMFF